MYTRGGNRKANNVENEIENQVTATQPTVPSRLLARPLVLNRARVKDRGTQVCAYDKTD